MDRFPRVSQGGEYSEYFPAKASVPQGSILGPLLYNLYTSDFPTHTKTHLVTFAKTHTSLLLTSDPNPEITSQTLQEHLYSCTPLQVSKGERRQECLLHLFTRLSVLPSPFLGNDVPLHTPEHVRCLGLHLDYRLTWKLNKRLKRIDPLGNTDF